MSNNSKKLRTIEEIALASLKHSEAKSTMRLDHSILTKLSKGGNKNG